MSKAKAKEAKKPTGRPTKRTPEVIERIIDGLSKGTPLTVICDADDMPAWRTVYDWIEKDEELSAAIARAREVGFDRIAMDAMAIADNIGLEHKDTIETKFGEIPDKEWILRSKLRVETRLKLLAKWDPKRYGDRIAQEISGPDGGPVRQQVEQRTPEDMAKFAEILAKAEKELT